MRRSSNVALKNMERSQGMTGSASIEGTINKIFLTLAILVVAASWTWFQSMTGANVSGYMMTGLIGGLILALVTIFKPAVAHITAPLYAAAEGLLLGALSAIFETQFPGIVMQAVGLTFAICFAMLFMYRTGIIKVTARFKSMVMMATMGILLLYVVSMVLSFFGNSLPFLFSGGPVGILISLFIIGIASLNLAIDFDFIDNHISGMSKNMEWYGAFTLLVTLVWIYIEVLRLLSYFRR